MAKLQFLYKAAAFSIDKQVVDFVTKIYNTPVDFYDLLYYKSTKNHIKETSLDV